jgi:hypothetical protein
MAVVEDKVRTPGPGFSVRPEHLGALVAAVLQKAPEATAVGIRATGTWHGTDRVAVAGEFHPVAVCPSRLSAHEALAKHEAEGERRALVILTPLSEDELGWDILVRLAKRRLMQLVPWDIVRDLFRAREVDPRITAHRWMAETLLEHIPANGYAPVPSGVLDADTAWAHVLGQLLGIRTGRPDADVLLEASIDPGFGPRFSRIPDEARQALHARIEEVAGRLGGLVLRALDAGSARRLVAIGLAAEVLFPEEAPAGNELTRAAVRLEPLLGATPLEPELGRRWFDAARRVVDRVPEAQRQFVLQQAEELLAEVRAEPFAGLSTVLPSGYDHRLGDYGHALSSFLADQIPVEGVALALDRVEAHRDAHRPGETERRGRLHMALRLARFLEQRRSGGGTDPRSLSDAVASYVAEGSYIDWARSLLLGGEQAEPLAAAVTELASRVRQIREEENKRFGERLAEWHRVPSREVHPVERVLDEVVAPAAVQAPVLMLVLDGMSLAAFRQLQQDIRASGWGEWWPEKRNSLVTALAAVPSITRISRMSLLSGRPGSGTGAEEARAFRQHPALVARSRPGRLPVLFHKGSLAEGAAGGLSEDVREAIRDAGQQVVGLVINVLDDSLAKSDQVVPRWSLDRIRLLEPILFEARVAGRIVVLTSDHGHVLDADSTALPGGEEERWRTAGPAAGELEIVLSGPRIQTASGAAEIIVPWSERVRYVRKKAGYHGGVTPQEMLVPVAVFAAWDREIEGWTISSEQPPAWWVSEPEAIEPVPALVPTPVPVPEPRPTKKRTPTVQASLFADPGAPAPPRRDWISALLDSPAYQSQRELAGRLVQPDETVQAFLELMERNQGRVSRSALSRALSQPEIRIRGIIAGLQRLLNVDGYPIVAVDEVTDSIELQRDLLRRQFQVEA